MNKWILLCILITNTSTAYAQNKDSINNTRSFFTITKEADNSTITKDSAIYEFVDSEPDFIGGEEALVNFLATRIKYPRKARENNEQGTVKLSFIVQSDGTIADIKIIKGVSKSIDEEAIRVMTICPKWKPAIQKGKKVSMLFSLPITFSLSN